MAGKGTPASAPGQAYVRSLFARAAAGADIAIIEGVMGLFDGASPSSLEGSTAEIAAWLNAILLPDSVGRHDLERILRRPEKVLRRALIERTG